jgi:hypothetical protein
MAGGMTCHPALDRSRAASSVSPANHPRACSNHVTIVFIGHDWAEDHHWRVCAVGSHQGPEPERVVEARSDDGEGIVECELYLLVWCGVDPEFVAAAAKALDDA